MTQRFHVLDPADPRAPAQEVWDAMSPEERRAVVESLPAEVPWELAPPEGDPHRTAKWRALDALGAFFRRTGKRVYLSSEIAVYYPDEPRFVPDLLAVLDVEPHERMKWVVSDEGKGLDLVLEVVASGAGAKDLDRNVARFAALGIPEYFVFDRARSRLFGWRLPEPAARTYRPIVPQDGRWTSGVLGLDLVLEGPRLRFYYGTAPLLETEELLARANSMLAEVLERKEEAERLAAAEAERAAAEAERAAAEAERVRQLEAELAAARAELERLRKR